MMVAMGTGHEPLIAPPAPLRQTSPRTIELREGGGWVALFGLPFFLTGVVLVLTAAGVLHPNVEPKETSPLVLGCSGLVSLAIGSVMLFGRRWLTLDLSGRSIIRRYGLLIPLHSKQRQLSEFDRVVIAYDPGDSDSPVRYPVRLRAIQGRDFVISTPKQFRESRVLAEYLSDLMSLPLADTSTDHVTVVAPERVHDTLRQRLLAQSEEPQQGLRPLVMRCQVDESRGQARIIIPSGGSWVAEGAGIVLPLVVLLVILPALLRFLTRPDTPEIVKFGFLLLLTLLFVLPVIFVSVNLMVGGRRRRTTVTASPAGIRIEQRSAWRTRTIQVPSSELLDLDCSTVNGALRSARDSRRMHQPVGPGTEWLVAMLKRWVPATGIIVKSQHELITFGEGLPAGELQYLTGVLRKALAGR